MNPIPDAVLVRAVLAGDRAAYDVLTRRYERAACAVARAVVRDPHAAEDAAQEAFLTAYTRLGELRTPAAFGSWLLRITRQKATRAAARPRLAAIAFPDVPADPDPAPPADEAARVLAAVAALPDAEAQVVMLHYFDGHPVPAVAALLGRPVGTVTKQLSRAYDRLRAKLEDSR